MTGDEIEEFSGVELNRFETDREEDWYKIGCIDGLKAADAEPNLESLWHDASEEPQDDLVIIYQDKHGDCWFATKRDIVILNINWECFATVNIRRWAYISDLLPKGGER